MIGFQLKRMFLMGIKSLWLHILRSLLTILGMIVGVCAVIAMLAIGEGASYEAQQELKQLGSTNIIVRSIEPPTDASSSSDQNQQVAMYGLTYKDVERLAETIPSVQITVPTRLIRKDIYHLGRKINGSVMGTVPWFTKIMNRQLVAGRFLTSADMHYMRNVCVLEQAVAERLFPFGDALGNTVKVEGNYYRVVGIMAPLSGTTSATGSSRGDAGSGMFIPFTTARQHYGEMIITRSAGSQQVELVEIHEATLSVDKVDNVLETGAIVRNTLQQFHKKQDYEVVVPLETLEAAKRFQRRSNIVLGCIAGLSLLVGGIGIMNIMLASVTERTREIGIRRALGAQRKHIIMQFLMETMVLSLTGGLLGIAFGVLIPTLVQHFAKMRTIITFNSLVVAFTISALTGIIFGLYPAYRAAQMDPIEALRHE
jgi:putative ABC transport system permease protein